MKRRYALNLPKINNFDVLVISSLNWMTINRVYTKHWFWNATNNISRSENFTAAFMEFIQYLVLCMIQGIITQYVKPYILQLGSSVTQLSCGNYWKTNYARNFVLSVLVIMLKDMWMLFLISDNTEFECHRHILSEYLTVFVTRCVWSHVRLGARVWAIGSQ